MLTPGNRGLMVLAGLSIILGAATLADAQVSPVRVEVEVQVSEDVDSQIASMVRQELRNLGDVQVVTENPHAKLIILGIENKPVDGSTIWGYTLSAVYLTCFDDGCYYYDSSTISTMSSNDFTKTIQYIVHTFDDESIEWNRTQRSPD